MTRSGEILGNRLLSARARELASDCVTERAILGDRMYLATADGDHAAAATARDRRDQAHQRRVAWLCVAAMLGETRTIDADVSLLDGIEQAGLRDLARQQLAQLAGQGSDQP